MAPITYRDETTQKKWCTGCNNLILPRGKDGNPGFFDVPTADLKAKALQRDYYNDPVCPTCTLFHTAAVALLSEDYDWKYQTWTFEGKDVARQGPLVCYLTKSKYNLPRANLRNYEPDMTFQFYTTWDEPEAPWPWMGQGHHITESGLSSSCMYLAKQWLDLCTRGADKHVHCLTPSLPQLPTRVVQIGTADKPARLHISAPDERAHYLALSHCWGGSIPVMTTTENLEQWTVALPAELPRTFKDALAVTQALGFEYLWIDSLCILQNSPADWQAEAPRMADIYSKAYLTLCADAASDSSAGFLEQPARAAPKMTSIPYQTAGWGENDKWVVKQRGQIHVRTRGYLAQELPFHAWGDQRSDSERPRGGAGRSRLATRGWVFQERVLAPRSLHFSGAEMAYECRSACECECSATSIRTVRTTSVVKHVLNPQPRPQPRDRWESNQRWDGRTSRRRRGGGGGAREPEAVAVTWRDEVVYPYSRLSFTVPEDRLPAIAGLATAFAQLRPGDEYVAGLWRDTLPGDLLWSADHLNRQYQRAAGARSVRLHSQKFPAPTWSWASITGAITYKHAEMDLDELVSAGFQITAVKNPDPVNVSPTLLATGHVAEFVVDESVALGLVLLPISEWEASDWDEQVPDWKLAELRKPPASTWRDQGYQARQEDWGEERGNPVSLRAEWDEEDPRVKSGDRLALLILYLTNEGNDETPGPIGLVLRRRQPRPSENQRESYDDKGPVEGEVYERVGMVDGYRLRSRRRVWGSDGFTELRDDADEEARETAVEEGREQWLQSVLDSPFRTVELV